MNQKHTAKIFGLKQAVLPLPPGERSTRLLDRSVTVWSLVWVSASSKWAPEQMIEEKRNSGICMLPSPSWATGKRVGEIKNYLKVHFSVLVHLREQTFAGCILGRGYFFRCSGKGFLATAHPQPEWLGDTMGIKISYWQIMDLNFRQLLTVHLLRYLLYTSPCCSPVLLALTLIG